MKIVTAEEFKTLPNGTLIVSPDTGGPAVLEDMTNPELPYDISHFVIFEREDILRLVEKWGASMAILQEALKVAK